ncbi:MAG: hypothetical protein U0075_01090 [Thermomicrobiales bacterium]
MGTGGVSPRGAILSLRWHLCVDERRHGSERDSHFAALEDAVAALLGTAVRQMALSPRAYHRVIKLARMLADLAAAEQIGTAHIAEALQYRPRMAEGWIGNTGTSRLPVDGDLTGLRNLREPGLRLTTRA